MLKLAAFLSPLPLLTASYAYRSYLRYRVGHTWDGSSNWKVPTEWDASSLPLPLTTPLPTPAYSSFSPAHVLELWPSSPSHPHYAAESARAPPVSGVVDLSSPEEEKPGENNGGDPQPVVEMLNPTVSHLDDRRVYAFTLPTGATVYGSGETHGGLERSGSLAMGWASDNFGHADSVPLYQTYPHVVIVDAEGKVSVLFLDTTWRVALDIRVSDPNGIRIAVFAPADAPSPRVLLVPGADSLDAAMSAFYAYTGPMPLPPLWALGYQQCRYSYYPQARVEDLGAGFRQENIPCDVIWMDIHYMDKYKIFTVDQELFPDPPKLNAQLLDLGFHTVWMIDPGVAAEDGFDVYESGKAVDAYIHTSKECSVPVQGDVWPGACVFPDFTRAATRTWWASLYGPFLNGTVAGAGGVWNDMNEPAVFRPSRTLDEDTWHRADPEFGGPGPHAQYHNAYALGMIEASRDGIQKARPQLRPFLLTRANLLGGHRFAAAWTGDNVANWDGLHACIPMCLNLALAGQGFCGPDIGGFVNNTPGDLFGRWMAVCALFPFARGHTMTETDDHEPWSFGPQVAEVCRTAIALRYRILPMLYTLFHASHTTGSSIMDPIWAAFPASPSVRNVEDGFLLGPLMVLADTAPPPSGVDSSVAPSKETMGRYTPHALKSALTDGSLDSDGLAWPQLHLLADRSEEDVASKTLPLASGNPFTPPSIPLPSDLPSLYLRPGSVIPLGPVLASTAFRSPDDPIQFVAALDASCTATGTHYDDAGDGYGASVTFTITASAKDVRVERDGGAYGGVVAGKSVSVFVWCEGGGVVVGTGSLGDDRIGLA